MALAVKGFIRLVRLVFRSLLILTVEGKGVIDWQKREEIGMKKLH